jgi:hypothetical protein
LGDLPPDAKAEALTLIQLLRERGNTLRPPRSEPLGAGLFELRGIEEGVRIFFTFRPNKRILLLSGIVKKRGRIPPAALRLARTYRDDWLAREPDPQPSNERLTRKRGKP